MAKKTQGSLSKQLWVLFQSRVMEEAFYEVRDANIAPETHEHFELILAILSEARALQKAATGEVGEHLKAYEEMIHRTKSMRVLLDEWSTHFREYQEYLELKQKDFYREEEK